VLLVLQQTNPALGSGFMRKTHDQAFCSDRCRDYVAAPPRKADGEWFIVAGPVDFCVECGLAIIPRKPHGYITPFRHDDGPHCMECHAATSKAKSENTRRPRRRHQHHSPTGAPVQAA
jgi:hypothetical protein